jgi:hypothetical protein
MVNHLLFACPVAKVTWGIVFFLRKTWGIVAICFNQKVRPDCYSQFWSWIKQALPSCEGCFLYGLAAICWATWKTHNKACFEKIPIKNPCEILFLACTFMRYWAGLYYEDMQDVIVAGAETMLVPKWRPQTGDWCCCP